MAEIPPLNDYDVLKLMDIPLIRRSAQKCDQNNDYPHWLGETVFNASEKLGTKFNSQKCIYFLFTDL